MIDVSPLRGSSVRDDAGVRGEIISLDPSCMVVGWWDEGSPGVREEDIEPDDLRVQRIEVLILGDGWVAVGRFVEREDAEPRGPTLTEDLENLLTEKPRTPFKTARKLGHSVRHGKWRQKRDYWSCSGSNYKYICKGKEGENKKITVKPDWKKAYNADYKEYQKAAGKKAAPFTKITMKRRRKAAQAKKKKK